jgi:STE24 endopeptidase
MATTTAPATRTINPSRSGISPWKAFKADPSDWFGEEEIAKAKRYVTPLRYVNIAKLALNFVVDLTVIRTHAMPNLLHHLNVNNWFVEVVLVMAVITAIGVVINTPFSWWQSMVHDKKWEFSTMTVGTFWSDFAKQLSIGLVINGVLVGVLWSIIRGTEYWWLFGWGAISLIQVGFAIVYPRVIAPLFNKFKPLDDVELHESILEVARSVGADIEKVEIEDMSKRDTRKNAYVGGAGKTRRMVVADTMLEWPHDEVRWVCGHEIGHWRLKHLLRFAAYIVALSLLDFIALKLLFSSDRVLHFAGVKALGDPGAVPLFFFAFALPNLVTGPIGMYFSRVHERQADLFGLEAVPDPDAATRAFRKMGTENLADLSPSLWKRLTHSHPEVPERLAMVQEWGRRNGHAA